MMTIDSKMAFNECTFGFVPHSGATYYLSRLPNEFGTFLALTGLPIHGTDAAKLKLVESVLQTTAYQDEKIADIVYSIGYDPREYFNFMRTYEEFKDDLGIDGHRINNIKTRAERNAYMDSHIGRKAAL